MLLQFFSVLILGQEGSTFKLQKETKRKRKKTMRGTKSHVGRDLGQREILRVQRETGTSETEGTITPGQVDDDPHPERIANQGSFP